MNKDAYLRNKSHCDFLVEHAWAHLIEDFGLDHVVTVHDHDDVFRGDLVASSHPWEDLREHDMVEVCAFAIELAGLLDAVSNVEHVGVACKPEREFNLEVLCLHNRSLLPEQGTACCYWLQDLMRGGTVRPSER
jgi:hypothetical protein